ncbi:helix-turn-helix transcriptional regulator [Nonomuraea sp. NPDC049152]|uniref:helix-turn-helix domain-containing protein n=1 Tax=Nonomuraea sp. NPDC049152 TaxID=3154350 RepID=UPI0034065520
MPKARPSCATRRSAVDVRATSFRSPGAPWTFMDLYDDALHPRARNPRRGCDHARAGTRRPAVGRADSMKWNLRLAAANRGIWKASELRRMLAERGVEMSVGKMSGLWSGRPNVLRPEELDAFCAVLGCDISELITAEPEAVPAPPSRSEERSVVGQDGAFVDSTRMVKPRAQTGRSLPPR